jgi:2-polyprenyl-3-methyl-5-hydroxy-6-metoxy-1,4-benzoquinol methylase
MPDTDLVRETSFGQDRKLNFLDRSAGWLSGYQTRRSVGSIDGKDVADFGCGFDATRMRPMLGRVRSATLVDVSLADDLKTQHGVTAIEGTLPGVLERLPDQSLDVILCMAVLEHLWEPGDTLAQCRRLLRPGGVCAISVPNWRGKPVLEFLAFRLGLSPACEMDDHKMYYNPRDLWPLLVRAGFMPHGIRCFRHKFTFATFAVCKVDPPEDRR